MIRVVLFGATGMVGEGVLHEALLHPEVSSVLVVGRRAAGRTHPKLVERVIPDMFDLSSLGPDLGGCDACFFCLGVSSIGMPPAEYERTTHDLTISVARALLVHNQAMTFCYVSGQGTDSSGKGRLRWARVKGRTENELLAMPFRSAYMFRPGFLRPTRGLKNAFRAAKVIGVLYPILRRVLAGSVCTLEDLGKAMINATITGSSTKVLENRDIAAVARSRDGTAPPR